MSTAFRSLADAIPHAIWLIDRGGACIWANSHLQTVFGMNVDDLTRHDGPDTTLAAEDRERYATMLRQARAGVGTVETTVRMKHVSAEREGYRTYILSARPLHDETARETLWVVTATDIHDMRTTIESREHATAKRGSVSGADRFQHAALPKTLPSLPGIACSAVYRAAKADAQIGGDWYDAFRLNDGRIVVSIGDVMGTGLDAAVTMAAVRQTIRGATQIYPDPVMALNAADRTLRTEQPDRIVTAFIGILDPLTLQFCYASAGHPPPVFRLRDGTTREFSGSTLPLGLRGAAGPSDETGRTVMLEEDGLLVLYTDGLTEATRDIAEGEQRLRDVLAHPDILEAPNPAAMIAQAIVSRVEDDLAILALRIGRVELGVMRATPLQLTPTHWTVDPRNLAAVAAMRTALTAALRKRTRCEEDIVMTELLLSELLGNVIRHTNDTAEVALDLTMPSPVLHVLDRGPGFTFHARLPNSVMSESGRGLFIAAMLAQDLTVAPRLDGGSHARIVLPFDLTRFAGKKTSGDDDAALADDSDA